jgi:hypothetical protein
MFEQYGIIHSVDVDHVGLFWPNSGSVLLNAGLQYIAMSGFMNFIGPGSAQYTGVSFSRQVGSLSAW